MQRAFAQHNESAEEPIRVRVGLNAGEPIAEEDDLYGTAVQLAARICAHAEAGKILAPIVFTSEPPCAFSASRTMRSCWRSSSRALASPRRSVRAVASWLAPL